jgi:simple sugar transport system ATP-binding protein
MAPLLALRDISKRFGPVAALQQASLDVAGGEVVGLLGENGAGKSTLMHIAAGMLPPDAGEILVSGVPRTFRSPREAQAAGIGMVHQHFTAIPALTVGENIALAGGWPASPGLIAERTRELTSRLGLPLDPAWRADSLPVSLMQRLEIVKALATDARVLLLDEPTGVLTPNEVDELLARVRAIADKGGAVVLISHKLDEALRVADRVVVLRRGAVVLEAATAGLTRDELADAMLGEADPSARPGVPASVRPGTHASARPGAHAPARPGVQASVRLHHATVAGRERGAVAVRDASLEVRAGEIVAIAGVEGSGQRELLRALAGIMPLQGGERVVEEPVALIPEDRTSEGLLLDLDLTANVALGMGPGAPWVRRGWMSWRGARERTQDLIARFDVRTPSPDVPASALSGGNQQKLVIARALERGPAVLVAENPTRGLDIRATTEVHARLREAAARGVAVIVYSSDLDEVLELGERVLVMARGALIEAPKGALRAEVGALMLGAL